MDVFSNKKFDTNKIYLKELPDITKLTSALFKAFDVDSLNFEQFSIFFKTYWSFRENPHLANIVRQVDLRQKIKNYIAGFQTKYDKTSEK